MLRRIPLRFSAPLAVAAPVLAVGAILTILWYTQSHGAVTNLADKNIQQIHTRVATHVDNLLATPIKLCNVNAHLVESGALDTESLESWLPTLESQSRAFDKLSAIVWGAADGRAVWISRYADGATYFALKNDPASPTMLEWRVADDGRIPAQPSNTFDFNLSSRPWFITPRDANQPTWCEPFVWVGGADAAQPTLGLSFGIPLSNPDGSLKGIIDADLSLNDLSTFLASIPVGKTGLVAIASSDGRMIAASNATPIVDENATRILARQSPDPLIAAVAHHARENQTALDEHAEITVDAVTYYVRVSPIGRNAGLDWTLATIVPEKDFTAEIDAGLTKSTLASVIAIAAAIAIGLGASALLLRPILTVVTYARRIGQGDLDTHVELNHAPEFKMLADELNNMIGGLRDRLRMRKSLSLAMEVQQNLLPSAEPSIEGLDIAGHSTYCDETGGDYYDYLELQGVDEHTASIALGDVMGHGVAAAMLMATARGILRSRCQEPGSLADFLDHLNAMLCHDTQGHRFMTMLLLTLDAKAAEMRWSSAGHGPPIVYDTQDDRFLDFEAGDLPLGIEESEKFTEHRYSQIRNGQIVIAATDGLWETKGHDKELFGMERVHDLIRRNAHRTADEISEAIRFELAEYRGPLDPDDDLTFVVVKVLRTG